eukprot:2419197-Pyramimonas_sp.AAC.1
MLRAQANATTPIGAAPPPHMLKLRARFHFDFLRGPGQLNPAEAETRPLLQNPSGQAANSLRNADFVRK